MCLARAGGRTDGRGSKAVAISLRRARERESDVSGSDNDRRKTKGSGVNPASGQTRRTWWTVSQGGADSPPAIRTSVRDKRTIQNSHQSYQKIPVLYRQSARVTRTICGVLTNLATWQKTYLLMWNLISLMTPHRPFVNGWWTVRAWLADE
jgi:hypothetical protein